MPASSRTGLAGFVAFFLIFSMATAYGETEGIEGKSLTLRECVAIGLKENPSAEISQQNLTATREKVGEAWGGYYPSLKLSSSYTFTAQQEKMTLGPNAYDTRFFLRQTLFDAGATANLVRSIQHSITFQEYEVRKTSLDIVLSVEAAFYDVLRKRDLVEVAKATFKAAERHQEQAGELYKEGLAPRSDVIKAEVQVSNAKLEVIRAENALLSAKATLATAMGQPVTTNFGVAEGENDHPSLPPFQEALTLAYDRRPELKGSRARIESAKATVEQVKSGFYPNISLDASYGWQQGEFSPNEKKWSVGLTVGIPLFEQLTTRSKINQARANLNGLKASEIQSVRSIELEVQQSWLALKEAMERLEVAKKALEQAEEDMRVSEGRYKEGTGNILEVTDAQTALTLTKASNVTALYDIKSARARLERATGKETREETDK